MSEEELYELAISDVPTYSLLNEILAIRDNRFLNEKVDYCINVNGYISLDVLNEYVKVVQENQQLKEENERYRKLGFKHLNEQNNQLKEVIKEVREYIDNNTELEHDGDDYGYMEWVNIKPQNIVFVNEILQILDKAKEKENENR